MVWSGMAGWVTVEYGILCIVYGIVWRREGAKGIESWWSGAVYSQS